MDGVPGPCQIAQGQLPDADGNGIPDCVQINPCRADFNSSGVVTVQDVFDFLAAYFAHSCMADVNRSGTVTTQDIFDYLAAYFAGCA